MSENENESPERQDAKKTDDGADLPRVCFDYLKSSLFRVIHADGVVGGLTPRLDIQMNFWSERFPIPKQMVHLLKPDGALGDEIREKRTERGAIIREVEAGVVLDLEAAKALQDWLADRIKQAQAILDAKKQEGQQEKS